MVAGRSHALRWCARISDQLITYCNLSRVCCGQWQWHSSSKTEYRLVKRAFTCSVCSRFLVYAAWVFFQYALYGIGIKFPLITLNYIGKYPNSKQDVAGSNPAGVTRRSNQSKKSISSDAFTGCLPPTGTNWWYEMRLKGSRMAQPWRHPKTGIFYFRKTVPAPLRAVVGFTEFKVSLGEHSLTDAV